MSQPNPEVSGERVALVAGGAGKRGVASGLCAALTQAGYRLVIVDVDESGVADAVARFPGSHGIVADLTRDADVSGLVLEADAVFGRIDALVNNAGTGLDRCSHEAELADFDRLFALNVRALWALSVEYARYTIARRRSGAIVNISSVHGSKTQPGYAIYAATKAAVEGLTRGLAVELGPFGIRCTAVAPGAVLDVAHADEYALQTDDPLAWIDDHARFHQVIPRVLAPVDIGRVVAFLLSEAAWPITGQTVTTDAGLSLLLYDRHFTGRNVASGS